MRSFGLSSRVGKAAASAALTLLSGTAASLGVEVAGTRAETMPVTVVELFTSEGCSSCPPADKNVLALAGDPGLLTLSFSVTYWDYLGWKDVFSKEEFTDRQRSYEGPLGRGGPFTPQVVVNGTGDVVGNSAEELGRLVRGSKAPTAALIKIGASAVSVGPGDTPSGGADVWLVRYDPRTVDIPVRRGENGGRTLRHKNVVHDLVHLGDWSGGPASFAIKPAKAPLRAAVLVQEHDGGPILAATTN